MPAKASSKGQVIWTSAKLERKEDTVRNTARATNEKSGARFAFGT